MKKTTLIVTCEHACNTIPASYQHLFTQNPILLSTHRAYDIGSLTIAEHLHHHFQCDYHRTYVSRLLIDCNRSLGNPSCFSDYTNSFSLVEKQKLVAEYYRPYRQAVEEAVKNHIEKSQQVLHISVHSFTPELNGVTRNAAIGILYDPNRHAEKEVARIWRGLLLMQTPSYIIRMNYPYKGTSDSFTRSFRRIYAESDYIGIELECNQLLLQDPDSLQNLARELADSLGELLQVV